MNATLRHNNRQVQFCDCDPEDCIEAYLLSGHWYESDLLHVLDNLKVAGNYLDIGAYVGTFSLFASLFCSSVTVYSFEPQIDIYRKLLHNLAANGIENCEPYNVALSNKIGTGQMTFGGTNRGGSTLQPGDHINVITLDSMNLPAIDVVKIDVEGHELAVLQGGLKTISKAKHLFIEAWPEKTCAAYCIPYTGDQVTDLLHGMGFLHQVELGGDNHYWQRQ